LSCMCRDMCCDMWLDMRVDTCCAAGLTHVISSLSPDLQHRETVDKYEAEFDHQVARAAMNSELAS